MRGKIYHYNHFITHRTYLSQGKDNVDLVRQLWMMLSKYLREYLTQQIVIFLQQGLIDLEGELGHVAHGERGVDAHARPYSIHFPLILYALVCNGRNNSPRIAIRGGDNVQPYRRRVALKMVFTDKPHTLQFACN